MKLESDRHRVFVWGHRGAPALAAENTVPSFLAALAEGVDGIELDVQLAADHTVVVLHDDTVDRTTDGQGWVGRFTWPELRRLRAKNPDGTWSADGVPCLDDVLDAVPPDTKVCVEYKNGPHFYPDLVPRTLKVIRAHRAEDRVMVSSFDHCALRESAQLAPQVDRAAAWGMVRLLEPWTVAGAVGAKFVHLHRAMAPVPDLRSMRAHGLGIALWSLRSTADVGELAEEFIDAAFVDDPAWAQGLKRAGA